MSIKLTNNCGGQLVDTLKSGTTLRLNNRESITVDNTELTPHIETLISKGLVLSDEVPSMVEESTEEEKPTSHKKRSSK